MLRREVYRRAGPFDEQFFLYFEETDFCKRAKRMGWLAYIIPAIRVEHLKGASFQKIRRETEKSEERKETDSEEFPDPLAIYFESLIRYLRKHHPGLRTKAALSTIYAFLKMRRWAVKDEKSQRIFEAFTEGARRAER